MLVPEVSGTGCRRGTVVEDVEMLVAEQSRTGVGSYEAIGACR
jgi:hypothetical protein